MGNPMIKIKNKKIQKNESKGSFSFIALFGYD